MADEADVRPRRYEVRIVGPSMPRAKTVTVEAGGPLSAALAAFVQTCAGDPLAVSQSELRLAEPDSPIVVVIDGGSGERVTASVRVLTDR